MGDRCALALYTESWVAQWLVIQTGWGSNLELFFSIAVWSWAIHLSSLYLLYLQMGEFTYCIYLPTYFIAILGNYMILDRTVQSAVLRDKSGFAPYLNPSLKPFSCFPVSFGIEPKLLQTSYKALGDLALSPLTSFQPIFPCPLGSSRSGSAHTSSF